jgi:hypothetical protein
MGIGDPIDSSVLQEDEEARRLERSVAAQPGALRHDRASLNRGCKNPSRPVAPLLHSPLEEEGKRAGAEAGHLEAEHLQGEAAGLRNLHLATTEDLERELARRRQA